jgi:hypothetical protein
MASRSVAVKLDFDVDEFVRRVRQMRPLGDAVRIVRDLAASGAPTATDNGGGEVCTLCVGEDGEHEEICPWRRACEWAEGYPVAAPPEGGGDGA